MLTSRCKPLKAALALLLAMACHGAIAADAASYWRSLGWFAGQWSGQEDGLNSSGPGRRCYATVMDGRFIFMRSETRFRPQPEDRGRNHPEQWLLFSRDHDDQRILLRRFGSGGQVMTFVLDPEGSRSDRFVFDSLAFDQGPEAARGRLTLTLTGNDSFREKLELGGPADALETVLNGNWRRNAPASDDCAPAPLAF